LTCLPIPLSEPQSKDQTGGLEGETAGFSNAFCNTTLSSTSYIPQYFDLETAPRISLSHHASCRNTAFQKKLLPSYAGGSLPVTRTTRVQQLIWSGLIPITRTLHAPAPGLSLVQLYLHTQCLRFAHCTHEALPKAWRTQTGSHCLRCSPQPVSAVRVHG
jgi:hypothetical protein